MAKSQLIELPLDSIICPAQSRVLFDAEKIEQLARSMSEVGQLQPVLARTVDAKPHIIDGERRVRAARLRGWKTITALVEAEETTEPRALQMQLVANCQRSDLTPMEKARAFRRLIKEGDLPAVQVAGWLGLSVATVSKQLTLLLLSNEMQEAVHLGRVAASTAYEIAKVKDPKKRAALEKQALEGTLTRDSAATASRTRRRRTSPGRNARTRRCDYVIELGEGRSARLREPDITLESALLLAEEVVLRLQEMAAEAHSQEESNDAPDEDE